MGAGVPAQMTSPPAAWNILPKPQIAPSALVASAARVFQKPRAASS